MSLTNVYVQVNGQIPEFFQRIAEGQAPQQFTQQHLKDLGFTSSSSRTFIPLLKALSFLSTDGSPTPRYHDFRDKSQSKRVMADSILETYSDLFLIKNNPSESDRALIEGKFKSVHNVSDRLAKLMANTFFALMPLADFKQKERVEHENKGFKAEIPNVGQAQSREIPLITSPTLHYNIQIHLPATKDIEVFNAIFKSLREHLLN